MKWNEYRYTKLLARYPMITATMSIVIVFEIIITIDTIESTWNYYQTTQHKILHRMIYRVFRNWIWANFKSYRPLSFAISIISFIYHCQECHIFHKRNFYKVLIIFQWKITLDRRTHEFLQNYSSYNLV